MHAIPSNRIDGRRKRGMRTKHRLVKAYISLVAEKRRPPTAEEVAVEAGCSSRSLFDRFNTLGGLELAVFDMMVAQHAWEPRVEVLKVDRERRSALYVAQRATLCETWLPLWRTLIRSSGSGGALDIRVAEAQKKARANLQLAFGPELTLMTEAECATVLRVIEAWFDFECWGRMRELEKLTSVQARRVWQLTLDWIFDVRPMAARRRRRRLHVSNISPGLG